MTRTRTSLRRHRCRRTMTSLAPHRPLGLANPAFRVRGLKLQMPWDDHLDDDSDEEAPLEPEMPPDDDWEPAPDEPPPDDDFADDEPERMPPDDD